jgi:hypothetical protein
VTSWTDPLVIATFFAGGIAGVVFLGNTIFKRRKERIQIELERFEEHIVPPDSPAESQWSIRVRPNKTMEHCMVYVGETQIPTARASSHPLEIKITSGGAENFRVPVYVDPFGEGEGQLVVVKDAKKIRKKQRFRTIPDMTVH